MILTAHQGQYLPGLRLFAKILQADEFCFFDAVQYERRSFENRNRIKTATEVQWLTVPVASSDHFNKTGGEIEVMQGSWPRKHLRAIELAYQKAPFFKWCYEPIEDVLLKAPQTLGYLNLLLLRRLLGLLGIERKIHRASEHQFQGEKSALVLDMCKKLGATEYIFGAQGENYVDREAFERAGVKVHIQQFTPRPYPQLHGEFVPDLSIIDLLMNVGPRAKEWL